MFVAAVLTQMMVYKDYLSVGNYQEVYLGTWLSVPVIVIFLNTKLLFQEERLSERTKDSRQCRRLRIWLLSSWWIYWNRRKAGCHCWHVNPGNRDAAGIYREIIIAFLIEVAVTLVLKKLPVFRKLL